MVLRQTDGLTTPSSGLRVSIALSIAILMQPAGMYLNFYASPIGWTNILAFVSCLILINVCGVKNIRGNISWLLFWILAFQFICIAYMCASSRGMDSKLMSFHLCSIIFLLALCTRTRADMPRTEVFIVTLWILSTILSLLSFNAVINGVYEEYRISPHHYGEDNVLEAFTMSSSCVINVISCMYVLLIEKKWLLKILLGVIIVMDIYTILNLHKRTPMLVVIIAVALFLFNNQRYIKKTFVRTIILAICIITITSLTLGLDTLKDQFLSFSDNFTNGINDMYTGSNTDMSGSAVSRFKLREKAWNYFYDNFGIAETIFGHGYMSIGQIDNQLLQAFIEMGFFGALSILLTVITPFYILIFQKSNRLCEFSAMLCLYQSVCFYNSGSPYTFLRWITFTILAYSLMIKHKQARKPNVP